MGQSVDVLALGAHALGGVDGESAAEAEEKPPGLGIGEALPVDLRRLSPRVAKNEARGRLAHHFDDISVVSDRGALAVDLSDGLAIHPQLIAGGDWEVEEFRLVAAIYDRLVGCLVGADLAARLEALAERPADVGGFGVGEGGERDAVARVLRLEGVVALDIQVGDLAHDLVGVAFEEPRRPVLAFHGEGGRGIAVAEQGGDSAVSACCSRRRSMGRGAIWLISSTMRTVLASGLNSPVSMALRSG